MKRFNQGDTVRKTKGSQWQGVVVGTYSTDLTPEGYAVESSTEKGSVQIYPAAALELVDGISKGVDSISEPVKTLYVELKRTEVAQMRATIVQQAARIVELTQQKAFWVAGAQKIGEKCDTVHAELSALKAQPRSAVVLPERWSVPRPIWKDARQPYGSPINHADIEAAEKFNLALDEVARLNSSPVSAAPSAAPAPGECVAVPVRLKVLEEISSLLRENDVHDTYIDELREIIDSVSAKISQGGDV